MLIDFLTWLGEKLKMKYDLANWLLALSAEGTPADRHSACELFKLAHMLAIAVSGKPIWTPEWVEARKSFA
jgi:hypothetical protein